MRIPSHLLVELCSMARSLSTMLFKGVGTFRTSSSLQPTVASGSLLSCHGLRYSTISDDSDTHEDFKPANKLDLSVQDVVEKDVKENPILIYMKGIPDSPRCGFSALAVRVLKEYGAPFSARNILEDPEVKSSVKAFSNWPTFPQIFINGEFVGGSDIILNMHQTGELKQKLEGFGAGSNP